MKIRVELKSHSLSESPYLEQLHISTTTIEKVIHSQFVPSLIYLSILNDEALLVYLWIDIHHEFVSSVLMLEMPLMSLNVARATSSF